ncbi:MAG: patatin-like phospholipase family protein [Rhodospirillaceae bacterium]|nr:patatin-like phospholipase family protein [Rhodospirillaceae bacterium]
MAGTRRPQRPGLETDRDADAPRIGLALGSGSARGLAHIGVLRALDEAGIRVDCVAGTSIGALVGAVYASGKIDQLESAMRAMNWRAVAAMIDVVFPRSGLIDGRRIGDFVRRHVHPRPIENLPLPFRAVATDLATGEEIVLDTGDVVDAVRASISVPGILTPVRRGGRILADGALTNPVPVSVARAMGAELVIAVDINHGVVARKNLRKRKRAATPRTAGPRTAAPGGAPPREGGGYAQAARWIRRELEAARASIPALGAWFGGDSLPNIVEVLLAAANIMETQIAEGRLAADRPEILIRPPLGDMRLLEFDRADEAIAIGYETARAAIGAIEAALNRSRPPG